MESGDASLLHAGDVPGLEVLSHLGQGSQATVFRVRRGQDEYALKMLRAALTDEAALTAFRREAALLACVKHPGIPRVHEVGVVRRRSYLIMDLVNGSRLTEPLAMGPLDVSRVVSVAMDIASALDAAHQAGVVHRDVKPDNIVLDEGGRPRLIDFGLAMQGVDETGDSVVGTMTYGAPEQSGMLRRSVDARADLYSLGVVLYECLTGLPPFTSPDIGEVIRMHATMPAPDVRLARPEVPAVLADLVAKLLAKDPDDRYQSAAGLLADLKCMSGRNAVEDFPLAQWDRPTQQRDPALSGRTRQLDALQRLWRESAAGRGGAVLVEGLAGSGKSRLVREFLRVGCGNARVVLRGHSDADEAVPFAPLREAVERHFRDVRDMDPQEREQAVERLRAAAGPNQALLATLSPALGELLGVQEAEQAEHHDQFISAAASFLLGLARSSGPAVLVLDDAQWLDDATRRVLTRVAGDLASTPLLVVVATRNDPAHQGALEDLRVSLDDAVADTLVMEPLEADSVVRIVGDMSGGMSLDTEAAAMVVSRTDGNALALQEYLVALMHSGLLRPAWGRWELDVEHLDDLPLAGSAVDLVIRRLEELDTTTRAMLGVAALIGASFSLDLLAQVTRTDLRRVARVVDQATWTHILERRGEERYAFLHNTVREAFLAQFDETSLVQHHQRIADVLVQTASTDPASVYATARHCQNGDVVRHERQVFRANFAAGRLALAEHSPAQAVQYLERAEQVASDPGAEFYRALGVAHYRAGRFTDAVEVLDKALGSSDDPLERASVLHLMAVVQDSSWDSTGEIASAERGLAELDCPLPTGRSALLWSSLRLFGAGYLVGLTRIGHGKVEGHKRDRYRQISSLYGATGTGYRRDLRPDAAALVALRELFYVNRVGPCPEAVQAMARIATVLRETGHERLARRWFGRANRLAEEMGDARLATQVAWSEAVSLHACGQDDGTLLRRLLDDRGQWLDAGQYLDGLNVLCWDSLLHGDTAMTEALFRHRRDRVGVSGQAGRNAVVAAEAGLLVMQGQAVEAAEHLTALRAAADPPLWERVDVIVASLLCALEQADLGAAVDEPLAQFRALRLAPTSLLPAQRAAYVYQAYARLEQCRVTEEERRGERLAQAVEAVDALAAVTARPLLAAHHHVARATLLHLRDEHERAVAYLDQKAEGLRRVDAPLVAFEAARLRARGLKALGHLGEADRQARYALSVADEQQWPRRVRAVRAEFGYAGSTVFSQQSVSVGHQSVRIHTHEGVPCSVFRHRLAALEEVSLAASRVGNPEDLARTALDGTIRMLHAERAVLFLLEGTPPRLAQYAGRDAAGNDIGEIADFSATLVDRVSQTHEAAVITSAGDGTEVDSGSVVMHGLRSVMAAPLSLDGRLLGVVYLDSRIAKGIFTNEDVGALTAVTNYVAGALETARARQLEVDVTNANKKRELADMLRTANADLTGTLDPTEVLRRLMLSLVRVLDGGHGWVLRPEPKGWTVRAATSPEDVSTPETPQAPRADSVLSRLMEQDGPVVGGADGQRPGILVRSPEPVNSWMTIPLRRNAERIGTIVLASPETEHFRSEQAELAAALAGQGLIAFDNARLFAQVRQMATTDELTRIANRRHFFTLATQRFSAVRDGDRPLAAMMVDIDHFKRVNDTHGHQVGDEVIRGVAQRFRRTIRPTDILGRYGGEEFALVLDADLDVPAFAEGLRQAITGEAMETKAGPLDITVSIGVALLRPEDPDIGVLLGRADARLYTAKQTGRNRVHFEG